jgi:uncharacterized RDD family membrane protein YckC
MRAVQGGGPERDLQGTAAGFVSRVSADVIDAVIIFALAVFADLALSMVRYLFVRGVTFNLVQLPSWETSLGIYAIAIAYLTYGWATTGQSPGKHLLGLRVVDRAHAGWPSLRAFLRAVLCVAFLPGILWVLVSRRNASLQDLVLRTAVIYDWSTGAR